MHFLCIEQKTPHVYYLSIVQLLLVSTISDSHAATYSINPTSTHIKFAIEHFKSAATAGGFYNISGQLQYDPDLRAGDISLIIPIDSLNTGNTSFNKSLTGPDFFDAKMHPSARFKSTKWYFNKAKKPQVTRVDGQLTLHGETHPIGLTATKFECGTSVGFKQEICGGNFTAMIDRTKWHINKFAWFGLTKNLKLNIKVEAARQ